MLLCFVVRGPCSDCKRRTRPERKKPTWRNTPRYSTTSAYSSTSPPARPGCSLSSHPTVTLEYRDQLRRESSNSVIVRREGVKAIGLSPSARLSIIPFHGCWLGRRSPSNRRRTFVRRRRSIPKFPRTALACRTLSCTSCSISRRSPPIRARSDGRAWLWEQNSGWCGRWVSI